MEEQLISFETALLAKEKGFFNGSNYFYFEPRYGNEVQKRSHPNLDLIFNNDKDKFEEVLEAPTQSLLQKWLREKHKLHIDVSYLDDVYCFYYKITEIKTNTESDVSKGFKTYEEALEEGLKEALNKI